jgi:hypothetical protein
VSTVLIAPLEHLTTLAGRSDLPDALPFPDTDALRALEVITKQRPSLVALERLFAATSRGTALINRIKADPALAGCEIRIVAHDSPVAATGATTAAAVAPATRPAAAPLDQSGTRSAPRTAVAPGVEVLIDGNPAGLVDISVTGLQVVSPTVLKPNQRVRVTLPAPGGAIRVAAGIAWASFEMPREGPRYRAGIEFVEVATGSIESWIATLTTT